MGAGMREGRREGGKKKEKCMEWKEKMGKGEEQEVEASGKRGREDRKERST